MFFFPMAITQFFVVSHKWADESRAASPATSEAPLARSRQSEPSSETPGRPNTDGRKTCKVVPPPVMFVALKII